VTVRTRRLAPERKAEIVEAALSLADREGPDRLTTQTIARAVGISQPAVFRHFPTKQALWCAVAEALGQRMRQEWRAALSAHPEPGARIEALVTAQLGLVERLPAVTSILFSRELHARNEPLRAVFAGLLGELRGHLEAAFVELARAGRLGSGVSAAAAASLVVSLLPGLAVRWSLGAKSFALVDEGQHLVALQLRALAGELRPARGAMA
jgi:AcrR family transcriptional regulator